MNNIITFLGQDHKSGVTMISQSAADFIADNSPELRIMLLSMNGYRGTDYVRDVDQTIEKIKLHIDHKTINSSELLKMCHVRGNFYMLGGIESKTGARDYFPSSASYIIDTLRKEFDLIICDAGNDIDNGLALGAVQTADTKICVISQNERSLASYEAAVPVYEKLKINFNYYVINKYHSRDPYDMSYIASRIGIRSENMVKTGFAGYARRAEMESRTLMSFGDEAFSTDISILSNMILEEQGLEKIAKRRRFKWVGSI